MKRLVFSIVIALAIATSVSAQSYYRTSTFRTPRYTNTNSTYRTSPGSYSSNQSYITNSGNFTNVKTNRTYSTGRSYTSSTSVFRNGSASSYSGTSSFCSSNMRSTTTNHYDGYGNYRGTTYKTLYK